MINEHLYYALKYFCNSKVLRKEDVYSLDSWSTPNRFCSFHIAEEMRVGGASRYDKIFIYHYLSLDNPLRIINNYTTEKLKDYLLYKRY